MDDWQRDPFAGYFCAAWGCDKHGKVLITIPRTDIKPEDAKAAAETFARAYDLDCQFMRGRFTFRPKVIAYGYQRKQRQQATEQAEVGTIPSIIPLKIRGDAKAIKRWGANLILKLAGDKQQPAETDRRKFLSPDAAVAQIKEKVCCSITNVPNKPIAPPLSPGEMLSLGLDIAKLSIKEQYLLLLNAQRIEAGLVDLKSGAGLIRLCPVCQSTYCAQQFNCGCGGRPHGLVANPVWPGEPTGESN